ncbi:MAG: V-type ATPase subunit [Deltaproteobacteria bacterium]|nr:V-type ATPase subunit [Deltaproteobacteria bacterium]
MKHYADNYYIHAKICALHPQLLTREGYVEIVQAGNAQSAFPVLLSGSEARNYITAKEILFRSQIDHIVRLLDISACYHSIFKSYLRLFEAENIKLLLAGVFNRRGAVGQWFDIRPYQTFPRALLKQNLSLSAFMDILRKSYLGEIAAGGFPVRYESLEIRIDSFAAGSLFRSVHEVPLRQQAVVREILFLRMCLFRHMWGERLRYYYGWKDEKIAGFLAGFDDLLDDSAKGHVSRRRIEPRIMQALEQSAASLSDLPARERALERFFHSYVLKQFFKDFHSVACVVAYLWLVYYQIENLFRIMEGFRFCMPPTDIYERLICED